MNNIVLWTSGVVWCGVVCGVSVCAPGWSRSLKKKSPAWCVVVHQQYSATLHHQDTQTGTAVWWVNQQHISPGLSPPSPLSILSPHTLTSVTPPSLSKQGLEGCEEPLAGLIWNGIVIVRKPFRSYLAATAEVTGNTGAQLPFLPRVKTPPASPFFTDLQLKIILLLLKFLLNTRGCIP